KYYFLDVTPGILKLLFTANGRWNWWRVTYNAGYTTIPADLAEACANIATYYVENNGSEVNVTAKIEGQRRMNFNNQGLLGFNNLLQQLGVDQIINSYANWPLINE